MAIEKREKGEIFDASTGLNIDDVLEGENVDMLGYIGWPEDSVDEIEVGCKSVTFV